MDSVGHHSSLTQPGETPQYTGKKMRLAGSCVLEEAQVKSTTHLAPPVGLSDDQDNDTED